MKNKQFIVIQKIMFITLVCTLFLALYNENLYAAEGYDEGSKTSESNNTLWEDYWNYDCVKTYADGTT